MNVKGAGPNTMAGQKGDQAIRAWDRFQAIYGEKPEQARVPKKKLDKDDFLRIMITQLQHQDPTKPFDMDKMAQEMTQMASLEQLGNVNKALNKLADGNRPLERLAMTNLIGKNVTLDQSRFPHQSGESSILTFNLPEDSDKTVLRLVSEEGEAVFEQEIGKMDAGKNQYIWDGLKDNTLPAKSGNYFMQISATGPKGQSILVNTQVNAQVIGVSFQGKEPVLLVGDSQNQSRVKMENVIRIEETGARPMIPGQKSSPKATNNMFTFKKGVGSVPLSDLEKDKIETSEKSRVAPKRAQPQGQQPNPNQPAMPAGAPVQVKPEGFPSGLGSIQQVKGGNHEG